MIILMELLVCLSLVIGAAGFTLPTPQFHSRSRSPLISRPLSKRFSSLLYDPEAKGIEVIMEVPPKVKSSDMIESATLLEPSAIIELYHDKEIVFGNYIGAKLDSKALSVQLFTGEHATIDVAQIVSIWDTIGDSPPPSTTTDWLTVLSDANNILEHVPFRKRALDEFWELASNQRSNSMAVDSFDVGVYLFQESKFRAWISPRTGASESKVFELSAAERVAAALLMHRDPFHFKRRVSIVGSAPNSTEHSTEPSSHNNTSTESESAAPDGLYVREGGYKLVPASVVDFKECETFLQHYYTTTGITPATPPTVPKLPGFANKVRGDSKLPAYVREISGIGTNISPQSTLDLTVGRVLHTLEMYALGQCTHTIYPAEEHRRGRPTVHHAPKIVRSVLNALNVPITEQSARGVLLKLGHSATPGYDPRFHKLKAVPHGGVSRDEILREAHAATLRPPQRVAEGEGYAHGLTPWSAEVAREGLMLNSLATMMRAEFEAIDPVAPGRRVASGHVDYRQHAKTHRPLCIDTRFATFLDDAFSLSPETGELLVHVVDVATRMNDFPALQQVIKERVSSTFLPTGPLHMLPPAALEGLKLSTKGCNEVLTIALNIDYDTGELLSYRVFPCLVGPVFPIDLGTANELITGVGVDSAEQGKGDVSDSMWDKLYDDEEEGEEEGVEEGVEREEREEEGEEREGRSHDSGGGSGWIGSGYGDSTGASARPYNKHTIQRKWNVRHTTAAPTTSYTSSIQRDFGDQLSARIGYPTQVVRDVRTIYHLVSKMCARYPWLDPAPRTDTKPFLGFATPRTSAIHEKISSEYSHRVINTLLSVYSQLAVQYCEDHRTHVPLAFSNRDRMDKSVVRRFATQPLRNWLAQLQQRQLRAALKLDYPMSQRDCVESVLHYNNKMHERKTLSYK